MQKGVFTELKSVVVVSWCVEVSLYRTEISCRDLIVCRSESLTQFGRHGRNEPDQCQKGENSIALKHSRRQCWPKIQTRTRFKITIFIRTKHNIGILGLIPFIKLQKTLK